MAVVKGQNLRIFVGGKPIAAALQCDLSIQLNTQEYSCKDDEGGWSKYMTVSLAWSLRANAVVTNDTDSTAVGAPDLMSMIGQQVSVSLSPASGTNNRVAGEMLLAGDAIISDVQITAQNRQRSVYDITLTGVKNMLVDVRAILTADNHYIVTADGHRVCAGHEA